MYILNDLDFQKRRLNHYFEVSLRHLNIIHYPLIRLQNAYNYAKLNNQKFRFSSELIKSHWHNIHKNVSVHKKHLYNYHWNMKVIDLPGGYISPLSEDLLLITNGIGELFLYPTSGNKFIKLDSNLNKIYKEQNPPIQGKVNSEHIGSFSVKDLFYDSYSSVLYVSLYININENNPCYVPGIYKTEINQNINKIVNQKIIFEKFFVPEQCNFASNFNGHAGGGRIKKLNDNIIFTIGDLDLNIYGDEITRKIPRDNRSPVGKVISLDQKGNFNVISSGHRNQQGLTIVGDNIFITEHGPRGGDEVNLIQKGKDYGWPFYSYGYAYSGKNIHRSPHQNNAEEPLFYFSPSIGISEIVYYEGSEFPYWNKKFLVLSLKYRSLFLLDYDLDKNRIKSSERINIGHRLRDIAVMPSGKIFLITDDQKLINLSRSSKDNHIESEKISF